MQSALLETAGAAGLGGRGSTPSAIAVAATFAVARLVLLPPPPRGKTGAAAAIPAACRPPSLASGVRDSDKWKFPSG